MKKLHLDKFPLGVFNRSEFKMDLCWVFFLNEVDNFFSFYFSFGNIMLGDNISPPNWVIEHLSSLDEMTS